MGTRALLLLASAAAWAGAACKAAPEFFPEGDRVPPAPVRVVFRPPEATPIVEQVVTSRAEGEGGARSVHAVKATLTSTFERSDRGFVLTQRTTQLRVERDGVAMLSPLLLVVSNLVLRVQLAADGAFMALANPEEVEVAVRQSLPDPAQLEQARRFFSADAVAAQAKAEWEAKFGDLLGRDVLPGHAWYSEETLSASGGPERRFVVQRKVAQFRSGDRGRELVVELSCPRDVEGAANPVALRRFLEESEGLALDGGVQCSGEQVIALEPFVPLSLRFEASASLPDAAGTARAVSLSRTIQAEAPGRAPSGEVR